MCKVCMWCVRLQTCVQLRQGDWGGENLGQRGTSSLGLKPTEGKEMGTPSCPHNPKGSGTGAHLQPDTCR